MSMPLIDPKQAIKTSWIEVAFSEEEAIFICEAMRKLIADKNNFTLTIEMAEQIVEGFIDRGTSL